MSRQNLNSALELVKNDPDLEARVMNASGWDEIAAIATELGLEISPTDIGEHFDEVELNEGELEAVTGGSHLDGPTDAQIWERMQDRIRRTQAGDPNPFW